MRRLLLLVVLAVLLGAAPASAQEASGRVLVVGVPGLQWSDVSPATPALQRLSQDAAVGVLSVKAVPAVSCPADGWVTLGAGNRASAGQGGPPCAPAVEATYDALMAANAGEREGAELGALAEQVCLDAEGAGPRLAATARRGLPGQVLCPVVLRATPPVAGAGTDRARAAASADRALARLLASVRAEHVLVVGLSEAPGDRSARLHVALAAGPAFDRGALTSASTRRAPYVQLVDVAPTVLQLLGRQSSPSMTGQPWRSAGAAPSPAALADLELLAAEHERVTVPFFVVLLTGQLALVLLALWRRRPGLAELVALGGVAALGASYLANLVPWWRSPVPLLTLLAVVLLLSAAVVTLALVRPRGGPGRGVVGAVAVVTGFTAAVLLVDLVTGGRLQMSSVAGYSPLVAGRFAGIGNVAFGVLAAASLLAAAAWGRWVVAVGLVVVAVDGAPPWGSDVGGVLALVPAFVLLALLLSGRRVSVLRLAGAGLAGVAVVGALALADLARAPQDRTHLGRFAADVRDGTAGTLLRRKAEAVLDLLFTSPVTALLPLVVAAAVYLVVRPPAPLAEAFVVAPSWRAGLLAVGLASAVGFAVNDSGAAVPAMALTVVVPATLAVVLRAWSERRALLA